MQEYFEKISKIFVNKGRYGGNGRKQTLPLKAPVARDGGATGVSPVQPSRDARLSTNKRATANDWNAERDLMYNAQKLFSLNIPRRHRT
jgi:hypothetical protein